MTAPDLLYAVEVELETALATCLVLFGDDAMLTLNTPDWQRGGEHQASRNGHGFSSTGRSILVSFDVAVAPTVSVRLEVYEREPALDLDGWDCVTVARMHVSGPAHLTVSHGSIETLDWPSTLTREHTFRFHGRGFRPTPAPTTWLVQAWPYVEREKLGKLKGLHLEADGGAADRAEAHRLLERVSEADLPRALELLRQRRS